MMITAFEMVTAEWLTEMLRESGGIQRGKVETVDIDTDLSYSSIIGKLTLAYSDDAPSTMPVHLFLKICRPDPKETVVGNSGRRKEVEFHNKIAVLMPNPPVVGCYQAEYSEETGASYLLFDDVSETHFQLGHFQPPQKRQAEKAFDAFAEFHAFWWDHQALSEIYTLPDHETLMAHIDNTRRHFPQFADVLGDRLSVSQRQLFEKTLDALPKLSERLTLGKNMTLIHGDPNWGNVLLPRNPETDRALIIDWQLVRAGFAAEDLSFLMALFWDRELRRRMETYMLKCYHLALLRQGIKGYGWTEYWNDYRLAIIAGALFTPMWFWATSSPESWWQPTLANVLQAVEDLGCPELL